MPQPFAPSDAFGVLRREKTAGLPSLVWIRPVRDRTSWPFVCDEVPFSLPYRTSSS